MVPQCSDMFCVFTHFRSKSSCPTGSLLLSFLLTMKPSGNHSTPCLCFLLAASIPITTISSKITTDTPTRYGKIGVTGKMGMSPGPEKINVSQDAFTPFRILTLEQCKQYSFTDLIVCILNLQQAMNNLLLLTDTRG